jgi:hypothetical protein
LVCEASSLDHAICRSQSGKYTCINCEVFLAAGLSVARHIAPAVVKQRTCVVSWCGELTNSRSSNNINELTQVRGVLSVVINRSKCSFGKLGPFLSKFHPDRNAFVMGDSGQTAQWTVV